MRNIRELTEWRTLQEIRASMYNGDNKSGWPVCDEHKEELAARLGELVHFYLTDNTPILHSYTLCEAHFTGCKKPATHRFALRA
jgi:hypothetical protein